jgi:hypothetical protein
MAEHEGELIADIRKNQREVLRISRREFKGRMMVDFRVMYYDAAGTLRLGKGGFGIDETAVPEIVAALTAIPCCQAGGTIHERKES